ncbi:MAG: nucleoside recognition domain-containing protein, partial [Clostridia bacterium]|nr:nucleoside recognition domain-containing protein [Clostridia bacterium]
MKKSQRYKRIGSLGVGLFGAGCILLLLFYADSAVLGVRQGLLLCRRTVIPALFPFMVASEILVGSGAAAAIGNAFARPARIILGVPGAA